MKRISYNYIDNSHRSASQSGILEKWPDTPSGFGLGFFAHLGNFWKARGKAFCFSPAILLHCRACLNRQLLLWTLPLNQPKIARLHPWLHSRLPVGSIPGHPRMFHVNSSFNDVDSHSYYYILSIIIMD